MKNQSCLEHFANIRNFVLFMHMSHRCTCRHMFKFIQTFIDIHRYSDIYAQRSSRCRYGHVEMHMYVH